MIPLLAVAHAATVDGLVFSPDGSPEVGSTVRLYDSRYVFTDTITAEDGSFRFEDLPPDRYRARVIPRRTSAGYEHWFGGAVRFCDARADTLGPDGVASLTAQLGLGATVTGTVYGADRQPWAGARVIARPVWSSDYNVFTRTATTDGDGAFVLSGLPPAPDGRDAFFFEISGGGVAPQYYRGAWDEVDAQLLAVPPAEQATLGPFAVYTPLTVDGWVTTDAGVPVGAGTVSAYDGRQTLTAALQPDGRFEVEGLRRRPLQVWVDAPGFGRTYAHGGPAPGFSVEPIPALGPLTDLTIELLPAGELAGRVLGLEDTADAFVLAARTGGAVTIGAALGSDGGFLFTALSEGDWALELYQFGGDVIEGPIQVDGAPLVASVTAGQRVELPPFEAPRAAAVAGVVRDDAGAPVYGATVAAVDRTSAVRISTQTARDGSFRLGQLPPGPWSLVAEYRRLCETDPDWVSVTWPDVLNPQVVGTVQLVAGEDFAWDPALPADVDGDGMADAWERANGLDPTRDDSAEDPDGDGFTNLQEYYLGTDPQQVYVATGCASAASPRPGWGVAWAALVSAGVRTRRRRALR